jgi:hypothetical protein
MSGKRKLSVEDVARIRQRCEAKVKDSVVAKEFGISRVHVWYIRTGWRWKK